MGELIARCGGGDLLKALNQFQSLVEFAGTQMRSKQRFQTPENRLRRLGRAEAGDEVDDGASELPGQRVVGDGFRSLAELLARLDVLRCHEGNMNGHLLEQ